MPDGSVPLLVALIVLVLFSAFFSATETAYSCVNKIKLRTMANTGNAKAKKVLSLAEDNYDRFLSTVLVGNNIVNLTAATLAATFFTKLLVGTNVDASVVSTAVTTTAVLIFGEITPKFIAKVYPEKIAFLVYPLIKFFYYVLYVFNFIFGGWKWLIAKIFRLKNEDKITEDEIMSVVEEAEEDGTLREDEKDLIRSVIEFDDLEVSDILVPRVNVAAINVDASMDEIKNFFNKEGFSRVPVYKDDVDTIIGVIHEKDFFNAYLSGKKGIDGILQNAFYTTEHVKISKLLKQLQKKRVHMAVVLDEYGGTLGIVTLEDILEELVGEIWDEHDEEVNFFKQTGDNSYLVDGNAPLDDFMKFFEIQERSEEFEANTVSGWIIEMIGEIPRAGYKTTYANLDIEVLKATVRRVFQIKVTVQPVQEKE